MRREKERKGKTNCFLFIGSFLLCETILSTLFHFKHFNSFDFYPLTSQIYGENIFLLAVVYDFTYT